MKTEVTKTFSWKILSYNVARKTCDKSFFQHHGSGIPQDILWFFNAEQLLPGEHKSIKLNYQGLEYSGRIDRVDNGVGQSRIFWNTSLAEKFATYENKEDPYALEFYWIDDDQYDLIFKPANQNAWLISWNRDVYQWPNYDEECAHVKSGGIIYTEWSCYNKNPKLGDDVFLIKLGDHPRGIVGHGIVTKESFVRSRFLSDEEDSANKENAIEVDFDCLLDYENGEILPQADLMSECEAQTWSPQRSGITINNEVMPSLWGMWNSVLSRTAFLDMPNNFVAPFMIGETVTNNQIVSAFKVGNMGGMRRSKSTGTLVIICDHTKGLYDDKWYGDVLNYTGMGKVGDQTLEGNQNITLYESGTNGVAVHLFEVLVPTQYIYQGEVELASEPFQESQFDDRGNERKVWIFPLESKTQFAIVKEDSVKENVKSKTEVAVSMSLEQLRRKAKENETDEVPYRETTAKTYIRDPYVARYARLRANGKCQLCGRLAPFNDQQNVPYLESHHIIWLSKGGADTIENTVGLCPNCHRKMHILDRDADKRKLISINRKPKRVIAKPVNH